MPTSGEIKNQNKALNEQLDIMSALAGAANQFEASGKNAAKIDTAYFLYANW